MSSTKTILCAVVAASALCAPLSVSAAALDATVTFRDVLKPNGHVRSPSEKLADGDACGTAGPHHVLQVTITAFEKCMQGKGWALDYFSPVAGTRPRSGSLTTYGDTQGDADGHPRDTAAFRADDRACRAQTRSSTSVRYKQCMAANGWKYLFAQYAPAPRAPAQPQWTWHWNGGSGSSSAPDDDWVRRMDDQIHTDEMNQLMYSLGQQNQP